MNGSEIFLLVLGPIMALLSGLTLFYIGGGFKLLSRSHGKRDL